MPHLDDATASRTTVLTGLYERVEALELSALQRVLLSSAIMLSLEVLVSLLQIPNPNMILIAGLVVCAALFGLLGGISASALMLVFTLAFFSEGHDLVSFTDENLRKVLVTFLGVSVTCAFTCSMREGERQAIQRLATVSKSLRDSNDELQTASVTDVLTGIRNRYSLRRDYEGYALGGRELFVLMLDVDDFKSVNDTYGHEAGDQLLERLGSALADLFGREHAYRYGGDEFLVIVEADGVQHQELLDALAKRMEPVGVSGGYVIGTPSTPVELRAMMHEADEALYSSKRAGKGKIVEAAAAA